MDNKKLEDDLRKLEGDLAPTAEMQLGETDVQQLVKDTDLGGRSTVGLAGTVMTAVGLLWVAFQLWYASPLPFCAALWRLQRHRSALDPPGDWLVPRVSCVSGVQAFAARLRAMAGLGDGRRRCVDGALPDRLLRRTVTSAGQSDDARRRRRSGRRAAAARGNAARRWPANGGAGGALPRICDGGPDLPDVIAHKGASIAARGLAHVDGDRRRVRHRARRVGQLHLRVRAVRHAARPRGRRQLHDAGELRAAGTLARRPGQSGRGVVGTERPDLRLVSQQRRVGRHLHDPADEARRLRRGQGGRDRDIVVGQRPDHAAGDGRGGVPDGRIRRHPLRGHRQARIHPGGDQLHRALLHRAPRSAEARHEADRARTRPHDGQPADVLGAGTGGQCGGARRDLLHRAGRAGAVRRGRAGDSWRTTRRPVRLQHLGCRTPARSSDRDRRLQSGAAAHLAHGQGRVCTS